MPCYAPVELWKLPVPYESPYTGKMVHWSFSRHWKGRLLDYSQRVSCGGCLGCHLRRSRDWAVRCTHQSMLVHRDQSWFITLTFDDEFMPLHPVTRRPVFLPGEMSAFIKRLRNNTKAYDFSKSGGPDYSFKFLGCREYGERTMRPHYHVCIFGLQLDDLKFYKRSYDGYPLFNSDTLSKAWQYRGHVVVAPSSFQTIAYTAAYTTKKIGTYLRPGSLEYATELATGEVFEHLPERTFCSNRPGIGRDFFLKHAEQMLALGSSVIGNHQMPIPRYYLRLAKEEMLDGLDDYELRRDRYYRDQEWFDDEALLRQYKDKLIHVARMVRASV